LSAAGERTCDSSRSSVAISRTDGVPLPTALRPSLVAVSHQGADGSDSVSTLKVVAIVDGADPQIRQLLDHIAAEHFQIEITDSFDRDVSDDPDVGAYIVGIDGDRREQARRLARSVRDIGFTTPLWALADSHQISDVAVFGMTGEVEGYIYLGQQTPAFYAKQVAASIVKYGLSLLPPFSAAS
jgi:ornithine decarboxylase